MKVAKTAPDALKILWFEKVFFTKKTFTEIHIELERRGYNFTKHALGMALGDIKFLTRGGKRGEYTYVQRHPYVEEDKKDGTR